MWGQTHSQIKSIGGEVLYYDATGLGEQSSMFFENRVDITYRYMPVHFGSGVKGKKVRYNFRRNDEMFENFGVQMGWNLRGRLNRTFLLYNGRSVNIDSCLFIDPQVCNGRIRGVPTREEFITDFVQPEWEESERTGKIHIEKSPRDLPSPDLFDSVRLAYADDVYYGLRDSYTL